VIAETARQKTTPVKNVSLAGEVMGFVGGGGGGDWCRRGNKTIPLRSRASRYDGNDGDGGGGSGGSGHYSGDGGGSGQDSGGGGGMICSDGGDGGDGAVVVVLVVVRGSRCDGISDGGGGRWRSRRWNQ